MKIKNYVFSQNKKNDVINNFKQLLMKSKKIIITLYESFYLIKRTEEIDFNSDIRRKKTCVRNKCL